MERNRKHKLLIIFILVFGIASLSIGFAAFSTTLNISSSATVTANSDTFSVKFSTNQNSLVIGSVTPSSKTSGITASDGVIDNGSNPTIKNLSATFTNPGQYVEYIFYARNEGEYTAYLNSVNFIGEKTCTGNGAATESLVQAACESINITATIGSTTYTETVPITGHTLNKKTGEQIKIRLEYASNGAYVDGMFTINFPNISLVYSTVDDSSLELTIIRLDSGNVNTIGSIVAIGNEKFYVIGQENDNVKLLSMFNLHVGNQVDKDINIVPLSSPTGIQSEYAIGYKWDSINSVNVYPWIGTTAFSLLGTEYSGSKVEDYVENYASYLEMMGANIDEVRLIAFDELESLGCSSDLSVCVGAPEFVYATSFWSSTAFDDTEVWFVGNNGFFDTNTYFSETNLGVCPVVEIPLSEF